MGTTFKARIDPMTLENFSHPTHPPPPPLSLFLSLSLSLLTILYTKVLNNGFEVFIEGEATSIDKANTVQLSLCPCVCVCVWLCVCPAQCLGSVIYGSHQPYSPIMFCCRLSILSRRFL